MVSFSDILVTQKSKGSTRLEKIGELIHWNRFGYRLEKVLGRAQGGRPPYPALAMFKIMILQHLYDLSDPEMEEMLYDRLSFRRFCGFHLEEVLPDETTICRFRGLLAEKGRKLLEMVLEELSNKGPMIKQGVIVDATVIESRSSRPRGGGVSETDPEAGWTKEAGNLPSWL